MASKRQVPFDYDGHLIFNEVCRVNEYNEDLPKDVNELENRLLGRLPRFEESTYYEPGSGYQRVPIREYIEDSKLPPQTKQFLDNSVALEYRYEDYSTTEAVVDGERREVAVPKEKTADIFWGSNEYMLFRGSEADASKAKGQTNTSFGRGVRLESIDFEEDFLLWLFRKAHDTGELTDSLKINRLSDAEISGSRDEFGGEARINKSNDIKQSEAILLGLLKGKHFAMIEGDFTVFYSNRTSATVRTEIQNNKIYVKASKAGLKNASKVEKLGLSTHITSELASLYDHWKSLPSSEKFVSPEFMVQLIETCHERDIDLNRQPIAVLRRQVQKRGESLSDYDFELDL